MLQMEGSDSDWDDFEKELKLLSQKLDSLEIQTKLSDPLDPNNAILSINAGAGGTESCDWAAMLLRMYQRWAERQHYKVEIIDVLPGDEAGIKNCTLMIKGKFAFGYIKSESGVHRLVRISPFDSNKRRHTSFVSIDVTAEIEDDIEVDIREEDLRIDTYRSSGAGGQHVNTTDSAVRITHMPTNIVVASQGDRSQHKNKATAMKVLKAKLYEHFRREREAEQRDKYGEKQEIGWGSQIRSYVLAPYQMVKDHRHQIETGNVIAVLDGDINLFVEGHLKAKK